MSGVLERVPMCSWPVTLGGGSTIVKGGLSLVASAVKSAVEPTLVQPGLDSGRRVDRGQAGRRGAGRVGVQGRGWQRRRDRSRSHRAV